MFEIELIKSALMKTGVPAVKVKIWINTEPGTIKWKFLIVT